MWLETDVVRGRVCRRGLYGGLPIWRIAPVSIRKDGARGLAETVERLGVLVYEKTPVLSIADGRLETTHGSVRAGIVVRATEAHARELPGARREMIPVYSLMIAKATEPLPASFWEEVGWAGYETFTDGRHLYIYATRTADDRIALVGRGAPYHFGSKVRESMNECHMCMTLSKGYSRTCSPAAKDARITHRWGGSLGIPRDWVPSVGYDQARGYAWAGGYVGDGVASSNLGGRTFGRSHLGRGERFDSTALGESPLAEMGTRAPALGWASAPLWRSLPVPIASSRERVDRPGGRLLMERLLPI